MGFNSEIAALFPPQWGRIQTAKNTGSPVSWTTFVGGTSLLQTGVLRAKVDGRNWFAHKHVEQIAKQMKTWPSKPFDNISLKRPGNRNARAKTNSKTKTILAIGDFMRRLSSSFRVAVSCLILSATVAVVCIGAASAQSGDPRALDQKPAPPALAAADANKDGQRKTDEFVEAAQAINGPAGNPECVWLGRRVVNLMWRDDLDTAFRHLDLYDRFGCPGGHVQAAFRCLVRFGGQIDNKVAETLNSRIQVCWINPNAQPQANGAVPPVPAAPASTAPQAAPK